MQLIDIKLIDQPWKQVTEANSYTLDLSFNGTFGHDCTDMTNDVLNLVTGTELPFSALIYREQLDKDGSWRPHLHFTCYNATRKQVKELEQAIKDRNSRANTLVKALNDKDAAYNYYSKQGRHHTLNLEGWQAVPCEAIAIVIVDECTTSTLRGVKEAVTASTPEKEFLVVVDECTTSTLRGVKEAVTTSTPPPVFSRPSIFTRMWSKIFNPLRSFLGFKAPKAPEPHHRPGPLTNGP